MSGRHQFNRQKLKSVIHYICASVDPSDLGKVKLHKILYFSDMLHYLETGQPLTGVEYQKQQFGPVAKHLSWALDELAEDGLIETAFVDYFGFPTTEYRVLARAEPALSERETDLIDEVAAFVCGRSARAISDLSYEAVWASAEIGETIPYFTAFLLVPCEVTDEDVAWGNREAARIFAES